MYIQFHTVNTSSIAIVSFHGFAQEMDHVRTVEMNRNKMGIDGVIPGPIEWSPIDSKGTIHVGK